MYRAGRAEEPRLSQVAVFTSADLHSRSPAQRTLALAGVVHALHDGLTDIIYVLLPVWQAQFGTQLWRTCGAARLYVGALASLQVPSGHLARHLNARTVLVLGTLLSAGGYILAGLSGGLAGLRVPCAGRCRWQHAASARLGRGVARLRRKRARTARHL